MDKLHQWWQAREPREKQILQYGGIISALLLGYLVIWQPLNQHIAKAYTQLNHTSQLAHWMTQAQYQLQQSPNTHTKRQSVNGDSLLPLINNTLQSNNLQEKLKQLNQIDDQQVTINFEKIDFSQFIHWLFTLTQHYQLSISQLTIKHSTTPGVVKVSLTLHC